MTTASNHLALCIINDGNGDYGSKYDERVALAQTKNATSAALQWAFFANHAAFKYKKQFGSPDEQGMVFTDIDILLCAAEVAEYYAEHIKELTA